MGLLNISTFVFSMLTLIVSTGSLQIVNETSIDNDMDKKEKRRAQNVEAAKKSYENKKKERSELQDKNKELTETQMKLIHEKSRLEGKSIALEQILLQMRHRSSCEGIDCRPTCQAPGSVNISTRPNINICNGGSVTIKTSCNHNVEGRSIIDDGYCKALDLTTNNGHSEETIPTTCNHVCYEGNLTRTVCDNDEQYIDFSTLGLGATQEVAITPSKTRRRKNLVDVVDTQDDVFVPTGKTKRAKQNPDPKQYSIRTSSSCAKDVLKKDSRRKAGTAGSRISY